MKGLKEFIEDLAKDNKLREKFKDITDPEEVVKMAKKEGYEFTEDEYLDKQMENVSGGIFKNRPNIQAGPSISETCFLDRLLDKDLMQEFGSNFQNH